VGEYYKSRVSQISYDARDIESFILAHANKTYTEQQWTRLGIFTGALVSALTQKEKQTTISVDLGHRTFHYLFGWTRHANNIMVKNLTGNHAFYWAGSNEGRVGNITGINITGHSAFEFAGSDEGSVGNITGINITGHFAFWRVGGYKGNVEHITGINITGDLTFWDAGGAEGHVSVLKYYEIIGLIKWSRTAYIHQKVLLTPQQAREYPEIVSACKSSHV
ncbi:hypothetical protein HY486_01165, partial [Candidatus Woesearchaeota archaeon]|nr:hypothetical protein [Candidatus Woesearchaeota archaeon]